jgi:hypothetical protein
MAEVKGRFEPNVFKILELGEDEKIVGARVDTSDWMPVNI